MQVSLPKKRSREKGQLCLPVFGLLFIMSLFPTAFAVDFMHMLAVKNELQNATDAGALAGALDLWTAPENAEQDALTICAANTADGRFVSNDSDDTTVTVEVTEPSELVPGQVEVTATMKIRNLYACLFDRFDETITTTSIAGTTGSLWRLNEGQAFPLAVSWDALPLAAGRPLSDYSLGETVTFTINSQRYKNAAWTGLTTNNANANYIGDAIDQALGLAESVPGFIPSVAIGDQISLNNGVIGQKKLAKEPYISALQRNTLVLPVISGDPAYTQTSEVIGFIGFRVTSVTVNGGQGEVQSISGILENPQVRGVSGDGSGTQGLQIGPVHLIK